MRRLQRSVAREGAAKVPPTKHRFEACGQSETAASPEGKAAVREAQPVGEFGGLVGVGVDVGVGVGVGVGFGN
jgi:hypothetical protein